MADDLKKGANRLEVRVTNLGVYRFMGDALPGTTNQITFTTMPVYQANLPLLPSGVLGPVTLITKCKILEMD